MKENSLLQSYHVQPKVWDEMFAAGGIRTPYKNFVTAIENLSAEEMTHKDELAKKLFMSQGITFTVYSSGEGIEKIFPFGAGLAELFGIVHGLHYLLWRVFFAYFKDRPSFEVRYFKLLDHPQGQVLETVCRRFFGGLFVLQYIRQ